jgi:hypothetical protein
MPLPLLHSVAPTMMTNTDTTVNFTKTEHTRFSVVPPVAPASVDGGNSIDILRTLVTRRCTKGISGQFWLGS